MNTLWYIQMVEYYSAMKRIELILTTTGVNVRCTVVNEGGQAQRLRPIKHHSYGETVGMKRRHRLGGGGPEDRQELRVMDLPASWLRGDARGKAHWIWHRKVNFTVCKLKKIKLKNKGERYWVSLMIGWTSWECVCARLMIGWTSNSFCLSRVTGRDIHTWGAASSLTAVTVLQGYLSGSEIVWMFTVSMELPTCDDSGGLHRQICLFRIHMWNSERKLSAQRSRDEENRLRKCRARQIPVEVQETSCREESVAASTPRK